MGELARRATRTVVLFPVASRRHAHLFAATNIKTPLCISGTHFTELSRWENIELNSLVSWQ